MRQCPRTGTFEEKGEAKRVQTEVPLLASLTPYGRAKPAHVRVQLRLPALDLSRALQINTRMSQDTCSCVHPASATHCDRSNSETGHRRRGGF